MAVKEFAEDCPHWCLRTWAARLNSFHKSIAPPWGTPPRRQALSENPKNKTPFSANMPYVLALSSGYSAFCHNNKERHSHLCLPNTQKERQGQDILNCNANYALLTQKRVLPERVICSRAFLHVSCSVALIQPYVSIIFVNATYILHLHYGCLMSAFFQPFVFQPVFQTVSLQHVDLISI